MSVSEINPELLIQKLTLSPDSLKLKVPFCMALSGSSGSGKSTLVFQLIQHRDQVFDKPFHRIIYCMPSSLYPNNSEYFEKLRNVFPDVELCIGIPKLSQLGLEFNSHLTPCLLILDDLMTEVMNSATMHDIFTQHSNHKCLSVCLTLQNYYCPSRFGKSIIKNCQYRILFYNRLEERELNIISSQITGNSKFLVSNFKFLFKTYPSLPSHYILIDGQYRSNIPQFFCRTFILPNASNEISPLIFFVNPYYKK